jgi:hypothetical protein
MSSFVLPADHIDYLVTAAYRYVPEHPDVAGRDPQDLGLTLWRENMGERIEDVDLDWMDDEERAEVAEDRAVLEAALAAYVHRPVAAVEPLQTVWAARCWQYQRGRQGFDDFPGSWRLADAVVAAALAQLPASAFTDADADRSSEGLRDLDPAVTAWVWTRARES